MIYDNDNNVIVFNVKNHIKPNRIIFNSKKSLQSEDKKTNSEICTSRNQKYPDNPIFKSARSAGT